MGKMFIMECLERPLENSMLSTTRGVWNCLSEFLEKTELFQKVIAAFDLISFV